MSEQYVFEIKDETGAQNWALILTATADSEAAARDLLVKELCVDAYKNPAAKSARSYIRPKWNECVCMTVCFSEELIRTMPLKRTEPGWYRKEFNVHLVAHEPDKADDGDDTLHKLQQLQEQTRATKTPEAD